MSWNDPYTPSLVVSFEAVGGQCRSFPHSLSIAPATLRCLLVVFRIFFWRLADTFSIWRQKVGVKRWGKRAPCTIVEHQPFSDAKVDPLIPVSCQQTPGPQLLRGTVHITFQLRAKNAQTVPITLAIDRKPTYGKMP